MNKEKVIALLNELLSDNIDYTLQCIREGALDEEEVETARNIMKENKQEVAAAIEYLNDNLK